MIRSRIDYALTDSSGYSNVSTKGGKIHSTRNEDEIQSAETFAQCEQNPSRYRYKTNHRNDEILRVNQKSIHFFNVTIKIKSDKFRIPLGAVGIGNLQFVVV